MSKLQKVRDLLADPDNWIQGEYKNNGCYCLVGALRHVWNDRHTFGGETGYMHDLYAVAKLTDRFDADGATCAIISFNDTEGRTHDEVLALLDKALEAA